jgi:type 1 glutamine amidotransferase
VTRRAFVTFGGWEGHRPRACAEWAAELLQREGFEVELSDALAPLPEDLSLIVPVWSVAEAPDEEIDALVAAVDGGAGLAAFHGAAATFHRHNAYKRLVGGTFVWHPEEREFEVELAGGGSFRVMTEQYYLHVDPANDVVASTTFPEAGVMPVAWRRHQGKGRVFYSALGHAPEVLDLEPVRALFIEGALWAAR